MKSEYSSFYTLPAEQYEEALGRWYRRWTGETLNLEHPRTFNEKIQWLKLYDSTPVKTQLADKYLVRDWVREKIGEQYLIPLLGVWDDFDEIDFDALPEQFVLKLNAGSGCNVLVPDKRALNVPEARARFETWMREEPAFKNGLELHYLNTRRRILAEAFISNGGNDLYDYKVFCIHGKAACILFMSERKTGVKRAFYDVRWNKLAYDSDYRRNDGQVPKPDNLDKLIALAEKLSEGFPIVRVDFYRMDDGRLFFGEMTFTPAGGRMQWGTEEQERCFGELIQLPQRSPLPKRNPLVSAVVQGCACAADAERTLDALLGQTLRNIEILFPDDGTDGETAQLLTAYMQRDARVRAVSCRGMDTAAARNACLDAAQGEFVMFADPCMRMEPGLLMAACRRMADQRADIVLCDGTYLRREAHEGCSGQALINLPEKLRRGLFCGGDMLTEGMPFSAAELHNKMFRRAFLQKHKLLFRGKRREGDIAFVLAALKACCRIAATQEKLLCLQETEEDPLALIEEIASLPVCGASAEGARLALEICFAELKKASGGRYLRLYRLLKEEGWKRLGLTDMQAERPGNSARVRQMQAMLGSDVMIRFE